MGDKYASRELVWVNPFAGSTIKYGFLTNADAGVKGALGHVEVTGAYPDGLVIGANAPKPPRASRLRATGTESSYCDADAVATARAAGWRVSPGKVRIGSSKKKSKTVYVTYTGGIKYAWNMPNDTYAKIGADLAALGIQLATSADEDLVFGARYPRVPRVIKPIFGTDTVDNVSTFCDPQKLDSLPEGWSTARASIDKI